jgi:hypothetical protein
MREEAQGFPTAWGSIGFPLHPKALEVSENQFIFYFRKELIGNGHFEVREAHARVAIQKPVRHSRGGPAMLTGTGPTPLQMASGHF